MIISPNLARLLFLTAMYPGNRDLLLTQYFVCLFFSFLSTLSNYSGHQQCMQADLQRRTLRNVLGRQHVQHVCVRVPSVEENDANYVCCRLEW